MYQRLFLSLIRKNRNFSRKGSSSWVHKSCRTFASANSLKCKPEHTPSELSDRNEELFLQSKQLQHQRAQIAPFKIRGLKKETANSMLMRSCLEKQPNIEGFRTGVETYKKRNKPRQGHMEFIKTAMKFIEPYKLERDIEVYKMLLDVFPRNVFDNRTLLDAVWPKPHPQINLALDILTKMEWLNMMPDQEMHDILYDVFGRASFPLQKVYRMAFWFDEFKDINPYELHEEVYKNKLDVRKEVLKRMAEKEDDIRILELSEAIDNDGILEYEHYIISCQSDIQRTFMAEFDVSKPLYVEGPFHIWLNRAKEDYFVLKTGQQDLVSAENLSVSEDEEREGVILGVCIVSQPYLDCLRKWISYLQESNPKLSDCNIVFNILSSNEEMEQHVEAIADS